MNFQTPVSTTLRSLFRFLLSLSVITALMTLLSLSVSPNTWAATSLSVAIPQSPYHLAAMSKTEAATKNLEGKAQEAIGNMTGDPKDKMMGKAKQAQSKTRNVKEAKKLARNTAKEMMKNVNPTEKLKDLTEAAEDKLSGMKK